MKFNKFISGGLAAALLSIGVVGTVGAAHNTNSSFESGVDPGSFTTLQSPDSSSIDNWTVSAGSVDYIGSYWEASDGTRSLDMSGDSAGTVTKTFSTVVGHTYEVTFALAGNPDGGPAMKALSVSAGNDTQTYEFTNTTETTREDMGWAQRTFAFTATTTSTTLSFASQTEGFWGPALDNVTITNVLTAKDQCKKDGYKTYTNPSFKNQGDCVSYVQSNPRAVANKLN
jgi:choice-of-anchor C domain-containing protein